MAWQRQATHLGNALLKVGPCGQLGMQLLIGRGRRGGSCRGRGRRRGGGGGGRRGRLRRWSGRWRSSGRLGRGRGRLQGARPQGREESEQRERGCRP